MKKLSHCSKGMGIGGWLTNYKRLAMLPENKRFVITDGDLEHFDTYIAENDVKNIASMGFDHIRLGFDQIVLESEPYVYRDHIFDLIERFAAWCEACDVRLILNMHKALGSYCDVAESYSRFDSEDFKTVLRHLGSNANAAFPTVRTVCSNFSTRCATFLLR